MNPSRPPPPPSPAHTPTDSPYDRVFALTYVANTALMAAVSVLFRYADFVRQAGGGEFELGAIVGVGALGAIVSRALIGAGIDRYGAKKVWLWSLVAYVVSIGLHGAIHSVHHFPVYGARILMNCSFAGALGASLTFVSLRVPKHRMAEIVGVLGSSGFVGMAIGPLIADQLFQSSEVSRHEVDRMFVAAAILGVISLVAVALATRGTSDQHTPTPFSFHLIRKYHPGWLLLVAVAMGLGISLPGVFLASFAAERKIAQIGTFFLAYNIAAFTVRMMTRRLPQVVGERRMILIGTLTMAASMPFYLVAWDSITLILPALVAGVGHAFLFPSVIAKGSETFPTRYRGLATTLILGMYDIGVVVGAPVEGGIIQTARQFGLPEYPVMFLTVGCLLVIVAVIYAVAGDRVDHRPPVS